MIKPTWFLVCYLGDRNEIIVAKRFDSLNEAEIYMDTIPFPLGFIMKVLA